MISMICSTFLFACGALFLGARQVGAGKLFVLQAVLKRGATKCEAEMEK